MIEKTIENPVTHLDLKVGIKIRFVSITLRRQGWLTRASNRIACSSVAAL